MPNVPANSIDGTFTSTSPLKRPARPADVRTKKPSPSLTSTIGEPLVPPSFKPPFATPTRTTRSPFGRVVCSSAKLPLMVWPTTSRVAGASSVPISTRRYGPAGNTSGSRVFPANDLIHRRRGVIDAQLETTTETNARHVDRDIHREFTRESGGRQHELTVAVRDAHERRCTAKAQRDVRHPRHARDAHRRSR
jgi:hypothetical protein